MYVYIWNLWKMYSIIQHAGKSKDYKKITSTLVSTVVTLHRNMAPKLFGTSPMLKIWLNSRDRFLLAICIHRINTHTRVVKGICRCTTNKLTFSGILGIGTCIIHKKIDRLSQWSNVRFMIDKNNSSLLFKYLTFIIFHNGIYISLY